MSKHTPGPWYHATDFGQVGWIETKDGIVIAQAQAPVSDSIRSKPNANARLIAAAPDMIDVLKEMKRKLRIDDPIDMYDSVCAAIAKATGETE